MAETVLSAGDLALTGFHFDNFDELGFVLLTNVTACTKIKFTDNGWQSNGSFRSNEGIVEWTADRYYTAGEIILPSIDALG